MKSKSTYNFYAYIICWAIGMFIFLGNKKTHAQDLHFSQFFASPISFNPANTGLFLGLFRVGGNYKNQWFSIPVPYHSAALYGDINFGRRARNEYGVYGIGLNIAQDVAGDGDLSVTKVGFNNAAHFSLGTDKYYTLSLGAGVTWVQKKINFSQLTWGNQWTGVDFNPNQYNLEPITKSSISFFDLSGGARFTAFINEAYLIHYNVAAHHINRPQESFLGNSTNKLQTKWANSIGGSGIINDNWGAIAEIMYTFQGKAAESVIYALASYNLVWDPYQHKALLFGLNARLGDAIAPVIGYEYERWRFILNYDVNVSGLRKYTNYRGGLELSVVYIADSQKFKRKRPRSIPCPVF
jgi:type IX secretion system PorP/SprF family membrane protein